MLRSQQRIGPHSVATRRSSAVKLGIEAAVPVTITVDGDSVIIAKKVGVYH